MPHEPRPVAYLSSAARVLIAGQAPGLRVHETGIPSTMPPATGFACGSALTGTHSTTVRCLRLRPWGSAFRDTMPKATTCRQDGSVPRNGVRPSCVRCRRSSWSWPSVNMRRPGTLGHAERGTMTETVERWRETMLSNAPGPRVLPLPHPSWRNTGWLKRHPWFEAEVLPVLRQTVSLLIGRNDFS